MMDSDKTFLDLSDEDLFRIRRPAPNSENLQESILLQTKNLPQESVLQGSGLDDSLSAEQLLPTVGTDFRLRSGNQAKPTLVQRIVKSIFWKPAFAVAASVLFATTLFFLTLPNTNQNSSALVVNLTQEPGQMDLAELEFQDSMLLGNELLFDTL